MSRKVGGAVRAQPREAAAAGGVARTPSGELDAGQDVVLVARPALRELAERDGLAGVQATLAELLEKAGLGAVAGDRAHAGAAEREAG